MDRKQAESLRMRSDPHPKWFPDGSEGSDAPLAPGVAAEVAPGVCGRTTGHGHECPRPSGHKGGCGPIESGDWPDPDSALHECKSVVEPPASPVSFTVPPEMAPGVYPRPGLTFHPNDRGTQSPAEVAP